jgi:hypothetical protein
VVVAQLDGGRRPAVARIVGRRQWRWGRRRSLESCGAPRGGVLARGVLEKAINGKGSRRKKTGGTMARGGALAGGSPQGEQVHREGETTEHLAGLDGIKGLGWWWAMVNLVSVVRVGS